jgi:NAD(P)-dependent dehydrogenase (short-subunit alcohol dehydrogenase family)
MMAGEGARIVLVDLDKDGLADVASALPPARSGMPHVTITADLSTADGVGAAMQVALAAADIDILVSNAGTCTWRTFDELSDADWLATFELNFLASPRIIRHLLPGMRERRRGAIVFTASDLARQPESAPPDYIVAKVGLLALTKMLALTEGRWGIRVNAAAPGPVWTGLWDRDGGIADNLARLHGLPRDEAVEREIADRHLPLGRIGQPKEAAFVICALASDLNSFTTGTVNGVDGGSIRGLL